MKRLFAAFFTVIFALGNMALVPSTAQTPVGNMQLKITSSKPGNLFVQGEPVNLLFGVTVQAAARPGAAKNLKLSYSLIRMDTKATTVTGSLDFTLPAGSSAEKSVSLTVRDNGLYTIQASVTDKNTRATASASVPLSILPQRNTLVKNDVFGVCTHFGHSWKGSDYANKAAVMAKAGIGWFRDEMAWDRAETVKGVVNILPEWDRFIDDGLAAGLRPLLILDYGNPLYDGGGAPYTQEGQAAFANYVQTIVSHFKGKVSTYEVWNEHNLKGTFFNPTSRPPEDYASLLKLVYTTIKAIDPQATVIGCSMSGYDEAWLKAVLNAGAAQYMDAVSFHPYCQPATPEQGNVIEKVNRMRSIVGSYGKNLPIWVTEIGWPTSGANSVSEKTAGDNLVRTYVLCIAAGVSKVFWYDLQNDGLSAGDPEHNFGLTRSWSDPVLPLAAKEAYLSYAVLTSQLARADYIGSASSGNTQAFRFRDSATGESIIAAWAARGTAVLRLNVKPGSIVNIYSRTGNATKTNSMTGVFQTSLSDSPIFIRCSER